MVARRALLGAAIDDPKADRIAIGREGLYDPNWALHAERALGAESADFAHWQCRRDGG